MTASGYLAAALRQWPIILLAAVLGLVGGFGYAKVATPVYTSSAQVLVAVESSGSTADRLQGASYIDQILPTYTSAVTSSLVLSPVISEFNLPTTLEAFRKDVSATATTGTTLITISASASTASLARKVTTAITERFIDVAPALVSPVAATPAPSPSPSTPAQIQARAQAEAQAGLTPPAVVDLTTVDEPTLPISPDSPNLLLGLVLGFVAGLLVGIGIALARNALDKRVRSESTIESLVGAPIIGRLPVMSRSAWARRDLDPAWAESVRSIRSALFAWGDAPRSVQFSSASPGEGTTSTIVAIARSLAKSGVRTVLVDADLRSPTVHTALGLTDGPGLAEVLTGSIELARVEQSPAELESLLVVPAGKTDVGGDLVASDALRPVVRDLVDSADIVLLDTPALVTAGDALAVSHTVSSVILVVALGGVTEQVLARTVDQLSGSGRSIAGVIVNRAVRATLNEKTSKPVVGSRP